jgi:hypothetical protein
VEQSDMDEQERRPKTDLYEVRNQGTLKNVSRMPFEEGGRWYYERAILKPTGTGTFTDTERRGPFASKAEAINDIRQ